MASPADVMFGPKGAGIEPSCDPWRHRRGRQLSAGVYCANLTFAITSKYYNFVQYILQATQIATGEKTSVFCLFPRSPHSLDEVFGGNASSACEVSSCDL